MAKKKSNAKVKNQRKKIRAKHGDADGLGSSHRDKQTLAPDALSPITENAIIYKMICYDRVVWAVADVRKARTVERVAQLLESGDPYVALGAARNMIAMEGQNIKVLETPGITQHNTQVNVQMNQGMTVDAQGNPIPIPEVELTHDTRLARIRFAIAERRRITALVGTADTRGTGEDGPGDNGDGATVVDPPTGTTNGSISE
jgi:hypothetical protein